MSGAAEEAVSGLPPELLNNDPRGFAWGVWHDRTPKLITQVRDGHPYGPDQRRALDSLQRLADHLPNRVMSVSTEAPQDILALVDSEYVNIAELLKLGRRARGEARAKIRTLLALEAHVDEDTKVSDSDVNRVEKGIKTGKTRQQVFPKLNPLSAAIR